MDFESFLLLASIFLIALDIIVFSSPKVRFKQKDIVGAITATVAFLLILTSYIILLGAFVNNDFSFLSVYSFSSTNLSLLSKIYA